MMGDPDYGKSQSLTPSEILSMSDEELVYSYTIFTCKFKFPKDFKYPSIPCYADEVTTVYPTEGSATLTGAEYITARNQGCEIDIQEGFLIPFKYLDVDALPEVMEGFKDAKLKSKICDLLKVKDRREKTKYKLKQDTLPSHLANLFPSRELFQVSHIENLFFDMPFKNVVFNLLTERSKYPKGTINNLLFKEKANSIYGLTVKGMSNKMKYDVKLGKTVRMESSDISNPILAS